MDNNLNFTDFTDNYNTFNIDFDLIYNNIEGNNEIVTNESFDSLLERINESIKSITEIMNEIPKEIRSKREFINIMNGVSNFISNNANINNNYLLDNFIYYIILSSTLKYPDLIIYILKSKLIKSNPFIFAIEKHKTNILNLLTYKNNYDLFKEIFNIKWFINKKQELFDYKDTNKLTFCNYLFFNNNFDVIKYMYENKIMDEKIILKKNDNLDTNLILGIKNNNNNLIDFFSKLNYQNTNTTFNEYLNTVNKDDVSCLHIACKHSFNITLDLLTNNNLNLDFLKNKKNLLYFSCKYKNYDILDLLIKDFNLEEFLYIKYEGKYENNILFSAVESYECFVYLCKNLDKIFLDKFLTDLNSLNDSIITYAAKFNLEVLEYLVTNFINLNTLIDIKNDDSKNYLYYILNKDLNNDKFINLILKLIENKFITKEILKENYTEDESILKKCTQYNFLFNTLFNLSIIDQAIFLFDKNLIHYLYKNENLIEILNSKLVVDLIKKKEITNKTLYLLISKICKENNNYINKVIFADIFSLGIVELLDIINYNDNGITILDEIKSNNLKFLLDNKFLKKETFNNKNNNILENSNYIFKNIILNNYENVKLLCDNKYLTKEMFEERNEDLNIIYYSVVNGYSDILNYLINHKFFNLDLIKYCNSYNQNLLMILMTEKQISGCLEKILNLCKDNYDILEHYDNNKWNLFMYACYYSEHFVSFMIKENFINEKIINSITKSNTTCLITLILKNSPSFKNIILHEKFDINLINTLNKNNISIFTYVDYIPNDLFLYILSLDIIDYNLFTIVSNTNICPLLNLPLCYFEIFTQIIEDEKMTSDKLLTTDNNGKNILTSCLYNKSKECFDFLVNSKKVNSELFFNVDNNNRNFLFYLDPLLIGSEFLEYMFKNYDGNKILEYRDYFDYDILTYYITNNYVDYVKYIINTDFFKENIFNEIFENNFYFMSIVSCSNIEIINLILNHKYFKNEYLVRFNYDYSIPLFSSLETEIFELFLDRMYSLKNYILNISDYEYSYLLNLICTLSVEKFKLLINNEYFTLDLLKKKDIVGHSLLTYLCVDNAELFELLIQTDKFNNKLLLDEDIDKENILMFCKDNYDSFIVLKNNFKDWNHLLNKKNTLNENPLFLLIKSNSTKIIEFLVKYFCLNKLLKQQNVYGDTSLHINNLNFKSVKIILENTFFDRNILNIKNNKQQNCFMLACQNNIKLAKYMLESDFINTKLLLENDYEGNNILYYIHKSKLKNKINFLEYILNSKYFNIKLINNRNLLNETIFFSICKSDPKFLDLLLNIEGYDYNLFTKNHTDYNTCLIISGQYNEECFKKLINWDRFDKKLLCYKDSNSKLDFFSSVCKYNTDLVSYIITNDKIDITNDIYRENMGIELLFNLLCKDPYSFKKLINSKYSSYKLINYLFMNNNFLLKCWDFQPIVVLFLLENKYFKINNYKFEIDELLKKINKNLDKKIKVNEISSLPLIKNVNIQCEEDDISVCQICYGFKSNVIFENCHHSCCLACNFKINKCHICRGNIDNKFLLYH